MHKPTTAEPRLNETAIKHLCCATTIVQCALVHTPASWRKWRVASRMLSDQDQRRLLRRVSLYVIVIFISNFLAVVAGTYVKIKEKVEDT